MLDAFVILFSYLSILCYLKFYHLRHKSEHTHTHTHCELDRLCLPLFRPFSREWHWGLIVTGLSLGTLLG